MGYATGKREDVLAHPGCHTKTAIPAVIALKITDTLTPIATPFTWKPKSLYPANPSVPGK